MSEAPSPSQYSPAFFTEIAEPAAAAAAAILPTVIALVEPTSAVDVGCGPGAWSRALLDLGVPKVTAIDGDYVPRSQMYIDPANFVSANLSSIGELSSLKERVGRFDLALSLEVAEHLDESCADTLVELLTALAPVVLFSASPPGQRGVNHVNEQWPEYWASRFRKHGYVVSDQLRWQFWNDQRVAFWYSQNLLLFVEAAHPAVKRLDATRLGEPVAVIHPALHEALDKLRTPVSPPPPTLRRLARQLPGALRRDLSAVWARLRRNR